MRNSLDNSARRRDHANKFWIVILLGLLLLLSNCSNRHPDGDANTADGRATITVWAHHGKPEEWKTIQSQVERFNASQTKVTAKLVEIAEANYDKSVQSAAVSSQLPDMPEFRWRLLANYAWKSHVKPLDGLTSAVRSDLMPSIVQQGTYDGRLYAVGAFDSGLGLYASRRLLEQINASIPTNIASAWKIDEFNAN